MEVPLTCNTVKQMGVKQMGSRIIAEVLDWIQSCNSYLPT